MSHRVLDPNDPDDLEEIKQIILEQEGDIEPIIDLQVREILSSRNQRLALNLQFYSMIYFNYRKTK